MKILIADSLKAPKSLTSTSGSWGSGIAESDSALAAIDPLIKKVFPAVKTELNKPINKEELYNELSNLFAKYRGNPVVSLKVGTTSEGKTFTVDLKSAKLKVDLKTRLLPIVQKKVNAVMKVVDKALAKMAEGSWDNEEEDDDEIDDMFLLQVRYLDEVLGMIAFCNMLGLSVPDQKGILTKIWPIFKDDTKAFDSPAARRNVFKKAFPYVQVK